MKTYVPSPDAVEDRWWVVDADGLTLGRLATTVASRLRGKHKPMFTPFLDTGDHVIVVNAEKVAMSGRKREEKLYNRYSGYPGGLKQVPVSQMIERHPERVIEHAVRGMLPKGPLGRKLIRKLKVYPGPRHPHEAQQPSELPVPGAARGR